MEKKYLQFNFTQEVLKDMQKQIKEQLKKAEREKTLLDTANTPRGIGKTFALIQYAKENCYKAIINKNLTGRDKILNEYDVIHIKRLPYMKKQYGFNYEKFVIDEDIDINSKELKDLDIVTGYCHNGYAKKYEKTETETEKTIKKALEISIEDLNKLIQTKNKFINVLEDKPDLTKKILDMNRLIKDTLALISMYDVNK